MKKLLIISVVLYSQISAAAFLKCSTSYVTDGVRGEISTRMNFKKEEMSQDNDASIKFVNSDFTFIAKSTGRYVDMKIAKPDGTVLMSTKSDLISAGYEENGFDNNLRLRTKELGLSQETKAIDFDCDVANI
jgi:hypothetical protein